MIIHLSFSYVSFEYSIRISLNYVLGKLIIQTIVLFRWIVHAPLLFLHSYIGWMRNSIVKFRETRNFDEIIEIILNFVKFRKIQGKFCGT